MPKKGKKVDPKTMDRLTQQYPAETVGMYLDQAFGKVESVENVIGFPPVERGDHIIIGGRTLREILAEEYAQAHNRKDSKFQQDFNKYYQANRKKLIHQRVAAAMMTGERVDFFIPDPNTGKIGKEPAKLVGMGFEPNPVKRPAQMTRWQKFWSKMGFYKDKVAEQENYKRQVEAQKRVQFYNKVGRAQMARIGSQSNEISAAWKEYYPARKDLDMFNLPQRGGYRLGRQSMTGHVNCLLAIQKNKDGGPLYTNEQLFDMNDPAMRKARADAAEEIYKHSMMGETGDLDWLCRLQHESRINLKERLDEQGKKVNFAGRDVTEQNGYREFSMLTNTAFELTQEVDQTWKRLDDNEFRKFQTELGELPSAINMVHASLSEQKRMLSGEAPLSQEDARQKMVKVMMGQAAICHFAKQQKAGIAASDFAGDQALDKIDSINTAMFNYSEDMEPPKIVQQVDSLSDEFISDPGKFSEQIVSGVLSERIQLKELGELGGQKPIQMEVLNAKTAERNMNREMGNTGMEV